jgi:hypothetical protein
VALDAGLDGMEAQFQIAIRKGKQCGLAPTWGRPVVYKIKACRKLHRPLRGAPRMW